MSHDDNVTTLHGRSAAHPAPGKRSSPIVADDTAAAVNIGHDRPSFAVTCRSLLQLGDIEGASSVFLDLLAQRLTPGDPILNDARLLLGQYRKVTTGQPAPGHLDALPLRPN